jgi:5'-deoxynucleotidase YfbR-like HD superfamily hydrolase
MQPEGLNHSHPLRLLEAISTQSNVFRYSLSPTIRQQSVAEHTGRASQIMLLVLDELDQFHIMRVSPEMLIACLGGIIVHDLGESLVGDTPYPVKAEESAFQALESRWLQQLISESGSLLRSAVSLPEDSWMLALLKAVDMAELIMFCTQEVKMGNSTMIPLLRKALGLLDLCNEALFDKIHYTSTVINVIRNQGLGALPPKEIGHA